VASPSVVIEQIAAATEKKEEKKTVRKIGKKSIKEIILRWQDPVTLLQVPFDEHTLVGFPQVPEGQDRVAVEPRDV